MTSILDLTMSNSNNNFNQSMKTVPDLVANLASENASLHYARCNVNGGGNGKFFRNYQVSRVLLICEVTNCMAKQNDVKG